MCQTRHDTTYLPLILCDVCRPIFCKHFVATDLNISYYGYGFSWQFFTVVAKFVRMSKSSTIILVIHTARMKTAKKNV